MKGKIQWTNKVVALAAGGVDEGALYMDEKAGRTEPLKNWSDWSRLGLAAVGYLGEMFNFYPAITEPLATVETALVTKTVVQAIRARTGMGAATTTVTRASAHAALAGATTRRVGWRPLPVGV